MDKSDERTKELENKNIELSRVINNLKMMQKHLIQTENMAIVGQLASGIAHEINNPLAYITNNMAALEKIIGEIQDNIKFLTTLTSNNKIDINTLNNKLNKDIKDIKDILNESNEGLLKIKNIVTHFGQLAENFEKMDNININECIQSALEIIINQLKYKCIIHKNYGELPQIKGSYQQLQIVFINILLNAVESIQEKGEIWIHTQFINKQIAITIRDSGCGIEQSEIDKIFNPFFTTKKIGEAMGLGLTTSYNIIKNHLGSFKIDSEVGKGTTFTIYLAKNIS